MSAADQRESPGLSRGEGVKYSSRFLDHPAAITAATLLAGNHRRLRHVRAVAAKAECLARHLDDLDRDVLIEAAWLHDVGYATSLVDTGFHPIDGARWLSALDEARLAGLVAHHSCSFHEANLRGLGDALGAFQNESSPVTALLTVADLTTGPEGEDLTLDARIAEITQRYGPDHIVSKSWVLAFEDAQRLFAWADALTASSGPRAMPPSPANSGTAQGLYG